MKRTIDQIMTTVDNIDRAYRQRMDELNSNYAAGDTGIKKEDGQWIIEFGFKENIEIAEKSSVGSQEIVSESLHP